MDAMTPDEREQFINKRVRDILRMFDKYKGKDISKLSVRNRDKYIEGRIATDLAIADELMVKLHDMMKLYEKQLSRASNTAALLFMINGIDLETAEVQVIAKIEATEVEPVDGEGKP